MGETFSRLSAEERARLTRQAHSQGVPLLSRWQEVAEDFGADWWPRTKAAAKYLQRAATVVDLGCGVMALEQHLARGQLYLPVDLCLRDKRTLVLDFNRTSELAALPPADACALLGVLEYSYDLPLLMGSVSSVYPQLVASYSAFATGETTESRLASGWVNHLTLGEVRQLFAAHGYDVRHQKRLKYKRAEYLFDLRRRLNQRRGRPT